VARIIEQRHTGRVRTTIFGIDCMSLHRTQRRTCFGELFEDKNSGEMVNTDNGGTDAEGKVVARIRRFAIGNVQLGGLAVREEIGS